MRKLGPIEPYEVVELLKLAEADKHVVIAPTHLVRNEDNAIVGYLSIKLPWISIWMDSRKNSARDSLEVQKLLESHLTMMGVTEYLMPCAETSPYFKHMEKLGFTRLGAQVVFRKELQ